MTDTNASEKEVVFWDCSKHAVAFSHESINGAVAAFLKSTDKSAWPDFLPVYGYAELEKPTVDTVIDDASPLESLLENLDNWVGPVISDGGVRLSGNMLRLEREFIAGVLDEYKVRRYQVVDTCQVVVNVWVDKYGHLLPPSKRNKIEDQPQDRDGVRAERYDVEIVRLQIGDFDYSKHKRLLDLGGKEAKLFLESTVYILDKACNSCPDRDHSGGKGDSCEECNVLYLRRTIEYLLGLTRAC